MRFPATLDKEDVFREYAYKLKLRLMGLKPEIVVLFRVTIYAAAEIG